MSAFAARQQLWPQSSARNSVEKALEQAAEEVVSGRGDSKYESAKLEEDANQAQSTTDKRRGGSGYVLAQQRSSCCLSCVSLGLSLNPSL